MNRLLGIAVLIVVALIVALPFVAMIAIGLDNGAARRDTKTRHPAGRHWLDPEPNPEDVPIDVTGIDPALGLFAWLTASMPDAAFEQFARDTAGAPLPNR